MLTVGWRATFRAVDQNVGLLVQEQTLVGPVALRHTQPEALRGLSIAAAQRRVTVLAAVAGAGVLVISTVGLLVMLGWYDRSIAARSRELEEEVGRRVEQTLKTREALIYGLAKLADCRDTDTGHHLDRICEYSAVLASALRGVDPQITDGWIADLRLAASLHDIGKVGISDDILLKPGALTPEERRAMQMHCEIGADTLMSVKARLGDEPLLTMGVAVALQHHERWDGTGYPFGLKGEEISLAARIVSLADVYDALTSPRVYKTAMTHEEACRLIMGGRGTQFDPRVADTFCRTADRFAEVRERLQPTPYDLAQERARFRRLAA